MIHDFKRAKTQPKQTQFTPLDGGFRLSNWVNPIKQWAQSLGEFY